jgi:hypothetical protein
MLVIFSFSWLCTRAQLEENFSDGDYTQNPPWLFSGPHWMVNAAKQLQSDHTLVNSFFYIATPHTVTGAAEWEFYIRLQFNTSSTNYVDVFLNAAAADLSSPALTGYFVRIGNTQDEVSLYRKEGPLSVKIIDGADGITNQSDNQLRIKVSRNAAGQFHLWRDDSGSGNNYNLEGIVTDNYFSSEGFFGFLVRQSTSSFFQKHFIDDISIRPFVPDTIPPYLIEVQTLSPNKIALHFSEPVAAAATQQLSNFVFTPGGTSPAAAIMTNTYHPVVLLEFLMPFQNGQVYTLTITNIPDAAGNILVPTTATFSYYKPKPFDIVIHEIMADPAPQVGLPNAEYIELRNTSGKTIFMNGWKIICNSSSATLPAINFSPDSVLIIAAASQVQHFLPFGKTIGVSSFPSLPNSGGILSLHANDGTTMHAVAYSDQWYNNPVKKEGGWSLEMTDAANPCGGMENWKASTDPSGGTPGRLNAVQGIVNDLSPPLLLRSYTIDSLTIVAVFDEAIDSLSASVKSNYTLTPGPAIIEAKPLPPLFTQVVLHLQSPLAKGKQYELKVKNIGDCKNNMIDPAKTANVGVPELCLPHDIIVNEILFNPGPGGFDFVEIYNYSNKIIDLSALSIANRNTSGTISNLRLLSATPYLIFPKDYEVFTEDPQRLNLDFHVKYPSRVLPVVLPTYANDKGHVVLLNQQGTVIDEVAYSEQLHFPLLKIKEGVSLEKIDPAGDGLSQVFWHSAASSAGYGTPGYQNSQFRLIDDVKATVEVHPKTFSPDQDGQDDFVLLQYIVEENGYMINTTIFNISGQSVRYLVKNNLMGMKGNFRWDGLNENGKKLPTGVYIIYTEIFNLQGKRKQFKNAVVIAGRH